MLHFNRALFVYNSNAGDADVEKKLSETIPVLAKAIDEIILLNTESEEELHAACIHYSEKVDLLVILGGDGTVHTCINSLAPLTIRPIIAILPGGTSNDFSRSLGIPQTLQDAATSLLNGSILEVDAGKADSSYFLNFWGIGLVTETSQNVKKEDKKNFGSISYILSTLRTLNQVEPFHYKIRTGNDYLEGEAILLFVLNGRFIGTTELPISALSPYDGKLDVLIVRNSRLASFKELFKLQNHDIENEQLNELEYLQTDELEIIDPLQKGVDMDGEIYSGPTQSISVLPKHFRMICNKAQ